MRGWGFQKTRLSDEFSFEQYREKAAPQTLLVAVVREDGGLRFNSTEQGLQPKLGDLLIGYGPKNGAGG